MRLLFIPETTLGSVQGGEDFLELDKFGLALRRNSHHLKRKYISSGQARAGIINNQKKSNKNCRKDSAQKKPNDNGLSWHQPHKFKASE